ncbi:MAG: hypothetical protein ACOVNZ_02275 [Crocinitomicaceae bacterium]|jgi:hypothetical protein
MLNGFVLDIHNENEFECEIPLFRDFKLPDGLTIKTSNSCYSYDSLVLMAKKEKFLGRGFQSDIIQKAILISPKGATSLNSTAFSINQEIIIDGLEHYLSIIIPPNSFGVFQLFPYLEA